LWTEGRRGGYLELTSLLLVVSSRQGISVVVALGGRGRGGEGLNVKSKSEEVMEEEEEEMDRI
jgi:hypothetical protein